MTRPKSFKASMAYVDGISRAIKSGRCCRHHDRPEVLKGVGLCAECWGVKPKLNQAMVREA